MEFDGDWLYTRPLELGADLHLAIVQLGAHKDTVKILRSLNDCYTHPHGATSQGVHKLLGPINQAIVQDAIAALSAGDAEKLGLLMTRAQEEFDRYAIPACPEELTAPVLHSILHSELVAPHIYGGKGVGSQGDGCAQFVARSKADLESLVMVLRAHFPQMECLPLSLGRTRDPSARRVGIEQNNLVRSLAVASAAAAAIAVAVRSLVGAPSRA